MSKESGMKVGRQVPSLADLCAKMGIDSLGQLGDVGNTDNSLLESILPYCTLEQMMHVEMCSVGRDLTPITDKLWKGFYEKAFGLKSTNLVIETMKQEKVELRWKKQYEAKLKEVNEVRRKSVEKLRRRTEEEAARKRRSLIKRCDLVPPANHMRRSFKGKDDSIKTNKGKILKKAKQDFLKSPEFKNAVAMKRNVIQRRR